MDLCGGKSYNLLALLSIKVAFGVQIQLVVCMPICTLRIVCTAVRVRICCFIGRIVRFRILFVWFAYDLGILCFWRGGWRWVSDGCGIPFNRPKFKGCMQRSRRSLSVALMRSISFLLKVSSLLGHWFLRVVFQFCKCKPIKFSTFTKLKALPNLSFCFEKCPNEWLIKAFLWIINC